MFVIDTTKSVKPDKDSIFNLTQKVVNSIKIDSINIPRFTLVSFNDFGPDINKNVKVEVSVSELINNIMNLMAQIDTDDVSKFGLATSSLKFESYDGGRDSKERLTQGLMVALQVATPRTLIVVFTDNGSKDLFLEDEIISLREEKQCEVCIVLTPAYEGKITGKSLPSYGRMGQVQTDVRRDHLLTLHSPPGLPHQRGGVRRVLEEGSAVRDKQLPVRVDPRIQIV